MCKSLTSIPGVGPALAGKLLRLGYNQPEDLIGADPEKMYDTLIKLEKKPVDPCVLYVFRCAVYYTSTQIHDPQLLKWWN